MAGTKVRVAGPDLDAAEEARLRFEQGLNPQVQAPNPTRSVDGVEPTVVDDITLAPDPLPQDPVPAPEPTPNALYLPNWGKRLAEARAQGDELRQGATIQRAGEGVNAAFMQAIGSKPVGGVADRMDRDAGIPEARVKEDMALEQAGLKRQKEMEETDPNSQTNINARATFQKDFPVLAQGLGDGFKTMTRKSLNDWAANNFKMQQLENSAKSTEARLALAQSNSEFNREKFAAEQENRNRMFEETVRNNREQNAIGWTNATRRANESAMYGGMSGIDFRRLDSNMQNLAKATVPFAESVQALESMERLLPGLTDGKLPNGYPVNEGARFAVKRLGGVLASNVEATDKALLLATQDFKKIVQVIRSGLTVTDQERADYEQQFGDRVFQDPVMLAKALQWYKTLMYRKLQTAQAPFAPLGNSPTDMLKPLAQWEQIAPDTVSYRSNFFRSVGGPGGRLSPGQAPQNSAQNPVAPTPSPTPAANKPAQTGGVSDDVRVRSPQGQVGRIPRAKLQTALDRGYTLVEE